MKASGVSDWRACCLSAKMSLGSVGLVCDRDMWVFVYGLLITELFILGGMSFAAPPPPPDGGGCGELF